MENSETPYVVLLEKVFARPICLCKGSSTDIYLPTLPQGKALSELFCKVDTLAKDLPRLEGC